MRKKRKRYNRCIRCSCTVQMGFRDVIRDVGLFRRWKLIPSHLTFSFFIFANDDRPRFQ